MANRYTYSTLQTESSTKKKYLGSTIYPKIKPNNDDIYIIVDTTDRLDLLANHYFGDASLWWVIAAKNNLLDIDLKLEPGTTLRIPNNITSVLDKIK